MMYPLLKLDDGTEIVHSDRKPDGRVKVYAERPDEKMCFRNATCWLPQYLWEDVTGFSSDELNRIETEIRSMEHLIFEYAEEI